MLMLNYPGSSTTSCYAIVQTQRPYRASRKALPDHLTVSLCLFHLMSFFALRWVLFKTRAKRPQSGA